MKSLKNIGTTFIPSKKCLPHSLCSLISTLYLNSRHICVEKCCLCLTVVSTTDTIYKAVYRKTSIRFFFIPENKNMIFVLLSAVLLGVFTYSVWIWSYFIRKGIKGPRGFPGIGMLIQTIDHENPPFLKYRDWTKVRCFFFNLETFSHFC